MKKLLLILSFFVLTISVKAQFAKPTGAVTIPTYSFFRNPADSAITIYQGSVNLYNTFVQHFDTVKLSGWVNNRKLLKYRLIGDSILKDGTASNYKLLHKIDSIMALVKYRNDTIVLSGYFTQFDALQKRNLNNHDSLSVLDEKSYNSLTEKPNLAVYRQLNNHDSLSTLQEKNYSSLDGKPDLTVYKLKSDSTASDGYTRRDRLATELFKKRALNNHDSLSTLDEKAYSSLTGKPDLTIYRQLNNHDSLSTLDEKAYASLTGKPDLTVYRQLNNHDSLQYLDEKQHASLTNVLGRGSYHVSQAARDSINSSRQMGDTVRNIGSATIFDLTGKQPLATVLTNIQDSLNLHEHLVNKSTTTTLGTSNTLYPTQNAVKAYADAKVADAITDGVITIAPSQNMVYDALALRTTGTGTNGYIPYWHGTNTFENSPLFTDGAKVSFGSNSPESGIQIANGGFGLPATSGTDNSVSFMRFRNASSGWAVDMGLNTYGTAAGWIQVRDATNFATNAKLLLNPNGGIVSTGSDLGVGTLLPNFTASARRVIDISGSSSAGLSLSAGGTSYGFLYVNSGVYVIGTNGAANPIIFETSGVEAMRISGTGLTLTTLAGTGDRLIYTNSSGTLAPTATTISGGIFNYGGTKTFASAYDLVSREYVDATTTGLAPKLPCDLATTAGQNLDLSGVETIDGTVTTSGTTRVLVKNQTTVAQNGVYITQSGSWTRSTDLDTWAELYKAYVVISGGSTNIGTSWICTIPSVGTEWTTDITWQQFGIANTITAGIGLTRSGDDIHANVDETSITIVSDTIRLKPMTSSLFEGKITDATGYGALVFANTATLVNPALGTPASGVATNLTGTATALNIGGNAATASATTAAVTFVATGGAAAGTTFNGSTARTIDYSTVGAQVAGSYQAALTNPVTGTGTTNYISKFTSTSILGNSLIYDSGTNVSIGATTSANKFEIVGSGTSLLQVRPNVGDTKSRSGFYSSGTDMEFYMYNNSDAQTIKLLGSTGGGYFSGNVGIGYTDPESYKLKVNGTLYTNGVISTVSTGTSTDWNTAYTSRIATFTTTGSSGSATLSSNTLNIPNYTLSGLGGQPLATILTNTTAAFTTTLDSKLSGIAAGATVESTFGTVTSVAALTIGTTGTDLSSSVATGTTTPVITLNVPTASAANRGALSAADWSTFNNKEPAITSGTTSQYWRGDKTWQTLPVYTLAGLGGVALADSGKTSAGNYVTAKQLALKVAIADTSTMLGKYARKVSPTFTGTVVLPSTTSIGTITNTELGYVDGVTSAIQTQFTSKVALADSVGGAVGHYATGKALQTHAALNSTTATSGHLSSTDWSTFNSKQATLVNTTNIKSINGTTLLGSGDLSTTQTTVSGNSGGLAAQYIDWNSASGGSSIANKPASYTPAAHTLDSHSNVTITSNASGEILKWNGSAWINNTLAEAGIQAAGTYATGGGSATGTNTGDNATNTQYSGLAASKQNALNGTGFVKASGITISYDNSTYLTAVPDLYLRNDGNDTSSGSVTATNFILSSDKRLKFNIRNFNQDDLDRVAKIDFRKFYAHKDSTELRSGVVADEVLKVAPEFVIVPTDPKEMRTVKYIDMLCAVAALQAEEIKLLKEQNKQFEKRITKLERKNRWKAQQLIIQ